MERNEILAVCIDNIRGIQDKFSAKQTSEEIRNALIEMNGGSTKISPKTFRPGNPLFELVQELIPVIIDEGIKSENNPLFDLVEYRNIAEGDEQDFYIDSDAQFAVASAAKGVRDVRRQRISGGTTVSVPTDMKIVRVYENMGRLLSGRITWDKFVDGVAKAFVNAINEMAFNALKNITASTAGLNSTYVKSGSITEANLLALVEHVEAATGKKAKIYGTKTAIRKLGSAVTTSNEINTDLYNQGYYGKISGVPAFALEQAHVPGTDTFALPNDALWVIAADDKPIKVVNEGDGLLIERPYTENADLTQEYIYGQAVGTGVVVAEKLGYWYSIT